MAVDSHAPQVSVIVRSMARASLDDALASIAAQRDVDAEVLVVAARVRRIPGSPRAAVRIVCAWSPARSACRGRSPPMPDSTRRAGPGSRSSTTTIASSPGISRDCSQRHAGALRTFQWNVESGDSGTGRGSNHDAARFAANRDRVYAKWGPAHDALASRTRPLLDDALRLAAAGRLAEADALCRQVLAISVNDPWALNLRAMLLRQAGQLADARTAQSHAVAVRPEDGSFVYNLALLDRAVGDLEAARVHARKASLLAPGFAQAHALVAGLG